LKHPDKSRIRSSSSKEKGKELPPEAISTVRSFLTSSIGSQFASLRASSAAHRAYAINPDIDLLSWKQKYSINISNMKHGHHYIFTVIKGHLTRTKWIRNWRRGKQQEQYEHATNNLPLPKSYKYLKEEGRK
jgi:hypothetical protein